MLEFISDMLASPLIPRAFIVAVLVGLAAPVVGTYLVQRGLALLGDGIGHIALTGIALGWLAGAAANTTPRDALASAGKTLVELVGLARELNVEAEGIEVGPSPMDQALQQDLALMIDELDLQARSSNALKREGIHTVGELVSRSEADLLDIRNFGAKSISEIKDKLAELGLSLKGSPVDYVSDDDYANPTFSDENQA